MPQLPKVMHVEDDPDIREIALIALEMVGGLEVIQFSSGQEALAGAAAANPDLFLLDVMMPGMTGEETLLALRAMPQFAATPAIFMTAKAQHSDVRQFIEAGALDVIVKPFDPMQLATQIVALWNQSLVS
ncbi:MULTISPECIES: response regulator [Gemmobacter]|jgi:CheY-like chemotaxis protein|uniref:Response regulator receiver domain-containing protein n=2 Tax=Gemmobacter TaxID=204456 RepID=A0A2T6AXG8_9RHOB|nr:MULTISPECIES: response regulator [Gemmobacter]PTX48501.1 response regulator receiver domain-containing protein [Gemmobacter caeni]TWI99698.1 response regulator receiver domain-containing protein [Gemmobacter caeni]GHC09291.1 response regulator [Gemmobacter nanjingensis]